MERFMMILGIPKKAETGSLRLLFPRVLRAYDIAFVAV
jgi:hypothetical protein